MSIIHQPPARVKRESDLQQPIAVAVKKYAACIAGTPDRFVNSALQRVLLEDADFRRRRRQRPTPSDEKHGHGAATAARA